MPTQPRLRDLFNQVPLNKKEIGKELTRIISNKEPISPSTKELLETNGFRLPTNEEVYEEEAAKIIELKTYKTEEQGDCAFHAALGKWNEITSQFVCNNVADARKKVADAIRQCAITDHLYGLIREAIQQIIISEHNPTSEIIQQVIKEYKVYLKSNEKSINLAWKIFEEELIKHRIDHYVNQQIAGNPLLQEDQSLNTLQSRFSRCLSLNDSELYAIILSIEDLSQKFQNYNCETNREFNLNKYLQERKIIDEYAKLIERSGYWLLPCELSILAYALNITIDYYVKDRKTREKRKIETFNPGYIVSSVCFNGINHYEKMAPPGTYNDYKSSYSQPSMTTKPVSESSNKWDLNLFIHFLKLMVISNNKAYRVDCKFEKMNVIQVKALLIDIRNELLKKDIDGKLSVLILRVVNDELIVFQIILEKVTDSKRLCLDIFSSVFLEDKANNLRCRSWNKSVEILKNNYIQGGLNTDSINNLIALDFLESPDKIMTRLNCYSVPVSAEYSKTVLLHKLFRVLELETREIIKENKLDQKTVIDIDQEYLCRAQVFFIKDASVAKAQQGFAYQEHLIMLLAYLAKEHDYDKNFSLVGEAMVPEAWNDVLLEWNEQIIFFQQKHRSSYSASVKETYSTTELLNDGGDASIVKYYRAYCTLVESIKDTGHPLYRYKNKLDSKNIKFIFFSNKSLPILEDHSIFHIKEEKDIKFEKVNFDQIPLIELKGFSQVIGNRSVWRIKSLDVNKLGLPQDKQNDLNEFIQLFYFFTEQMNSDELFQHCKRIICAPLGGFGQAVLADTFAHYVHNWFVTENPVNHVFDRTVITDFFDNHEKYHHNLVKYSCYNHPAKEIEKLIREHLISLKRLSCCKQVTRITTIPGSHIVISCEDPLLAVVLIQELFPAGERQVFTPFSELIKYQITDGLKYAIIVGEDNEMFDIVCKIKERNKGKTENIINLIQVKSALHNQYDITLNIQPKELEFLWQQEQKYKGLSIFINNDDICVTNLLCFAVTSLTDNFSSDELSRYVPQRLTNEELVLPYDKLEKGIKEWVKSNKEIDNHWELEELQNGKKYRCKIQVTLPTCFLDKSIQAPNNPKFELIKETGLLYYIHSEKDFAPVNFPCENFSQTNINFEDFELDINRKIKEQKIFDKNYKDFPDVLKIIKLKLEKEYNGDKLPKEKFGLSRDKKVIFYYPYSRPTPRACVVEWKDIYLDRIVYIIEAEAACGKTWHLRSKISLEQMLNNKRIPIFIRMKDMEKIKDPHDPINELLNKSLLPTHIACMVKKYPKYFHLLLDGYDELSNEFSEKFEVMLDAIISKDYCVTITVRDYQKTKLQHQTSSIIVQQRLHRFNDVEIKSCLKKSLIQKLAINEDDFNLEIQRLCVWLQEQVEVSEWLGIPFHVALISEWYVYNRGAFLNAVRPSISEIYNFIVQHQIERGSKRSRGDIYKILNKLAWVQVFGDQKGYNRFSMKDYHFKMDLSFDLERTGLMRDPYAESPELFHRTFAEFLVAKRLSRKLISSSCRNHEFNFELIRLLYQTEYRLVYHFFIGLFETHRTDLDMPYELLQSDQKNFEQVWLIDIIGQNLNDQKNSKLIIWCNSEEDKSEDEDMGNNLDPSEIIDNFSLILENFNKNNPSVDQLKKDAHRDYLKKYFAIYQSIPDEVNRRCLHKEIRDMNIRLFLREDYPPHEVSIFEKYKLLDEFDIKLIDSAFQHLKQISEKYNWRSNSNSNAFKCWSEGGYKDQDFAMPILRCIGSHLNIIHVFYIRLYVTYGGYSKSDDEAIISAALNHIKHLKDKKNLKVVFSSILLFLSMIDDWAASQEHPQLSRKIVEQMVKCFEMLLMDNDIKDNNHETRLFIQILLIDFISYFKLRIYLDCNGTQQANIPTLRLIFPDGFTRKLDVFCNSFDQRIYRKIYQLYSNSEQYTGIGRFQRFFDIWKNVFSNLSENESETEKKLSQNINTLVTFTNTQNGKPTVDMEQDAEVFSDRSSDRVSPNKRAKLGGTGPMPF